MRVTYYGLGFKNTMRMCFSCLHTVVHPAHVALAGRCASSLAPVHYTLYMNNSTPYSESIQIWVLEDLIKSRFSGVN
jgi:hypothetical protein